MQFKFLQGDMLHLSLSISACLFIFFVSYIQIEGIVCNLILPVFINVCYIIENLSLFQQIKCYESELKNNILTIQALRENCRQLIIQNTDIEIEKRKCWIKDPTRSKSALF